MKRILGAILFVAYSIVAITVTILLLSFNDYKMSQIGDYTVYIANDDLLEPRFEEGSILIIEKSTDRNINTGDELFFYKVMNSQEFEVVTAKLQNRIYQGSRTAYITENGETYSSDYFIGKVDDTKVIPSPWGVILSILESKWGFLFCIVIVSLLLFLQEVFDLIIEIKYGSKSTSTKKSNGTKGTTKGVKTGTAKKPTTKKAPTTAAPGATAARKTATTAPVNNEVQTGEKEG